MNIGAGRVVYQDIVRIELAIKKRELAKNPVLIEAFERAAKGNGRLHFLGLVSDGGYVDRDMVCCFSSALNGLTLLSLSPYQRPFAYDTLEGAAGGGKGLWTEGTVCALFW